MRSMFWIAPVLMLAQAGTSIAEENVRAPRIVNGYSEDIQYAPWQVFIEFDNGDGTYDACGGFVISDQYVLTAAHCAVGHNASATTVYAGIDDLANITASNVIDVSDVTVYPGYSASTLTGDLALIRLADSLPAGVKPIGLLTPSEQIDMDNQFETGQRNNLYVAGWGATSTGGGGVTRYLLFTFLNGVPDDQCSWTSVNGVYNQALGDALVCANQTRTTGVCDGDSGGALVWRDPNLASNSDLGYRAVGIVSFSSGTLGCGSTQSEDAFTQISTYLNWIDGEVGGYSQPNPSFSLDIFEPPSDNTTNDSGGGGSLG